jgi:hypothetical protein
VLKYLNTHIFIIHEILFFPPEVDAGNAESKTGNDFQESADQLEESTEQVIELETAEASF